MSEHYEHFVDSESIFEGRVICVQRDTVELENGARAYREVVRHNGGAAVIAINDAGEITLVKQYRYPFAKELIEIPAGKLEKGEDPFAAAKRELAEEAGIEADKYYDLGYVIPTCGYCDEKIFIYAAKQLRTVPCNLDEDEFVSVFTLPLDTAADAVLKGEINDSKTALAILKLKTLRDKGIF